MGKHRSPQLPDDDRLYEVGYRKPPEHSRFQHGNQGNRKGRKPKAKKSVTENTDDILTRRVKLRQDGKMVWMTYQELILLKHANKAVQGDVRSAQLLFKLKSQDKDPASSEGQPLDADEVAILKRYLADVIAGNKSVDGSFSDDYRDYKDPEDES